MKQPALVIVAVVFCLGVGAASWLIGPVRWVVAAAIIISLALVLRDVLQILLICLALTGGILRIGMVPLTPPASTTESYGKTRDVQLTVSDIRSHRIDSQQVVATVATGPRVLVTAPGYPPLSPGDIINTPATLQAPRNFSSFDYRSYLAKDGIHATVSLRQLEITSHRGGLAGRLFSVKRTLNQAIVARISEPVGSFLQGILLGERSAMPDWLVDDFRRTGTSHVLALSGYNISIILGAVVAVLGRRPIMVGVSVLFVIGFVCLVGPSAPVVRAALMGSLLILSQALGRPALAVRLCLITAALTLLISPWALRYDVGWQLSFLATLGILLTAGPLAARLQRFPELLRKPLAVTLAAGLFTAPIIILSFGTTSIISPVANLLIVPLIPWLMLGGVVTAMVQSLVPMAAPLFAIPTDWLGRLCLGTVHWLGGLSFSDVTVPPAISKLVAVGATALAVVVAVRIRKELDAA